jgi:hypothetical protein
MFILVGEVMTNKIFPQSHKKETKIKKINVIISTVPPCVSSVS